MTDIQAKAQKRTQIILKVQSGQMTATQAAKQLNLSRTAYYEWENKALAAIVQSQIEKPPGRPKQHKDPEKIQLQTQVVQLKAEVEMLKQDRHIRRLLFGDINPAHPGAEEIPDITEKKSPAKRKRKKNAKSKKSRRRH